MVYILQSLSRAIATSHGLEMWADAWTGTDLSECKRQLCMCRNMFPDAVYRIVTIVEG